MLAIDDTNFWQKKEKNGMNGSFLKFFIMIMIIGVATLYSFDETEGRESSFIPFPKCPTCMQPAIANWECPRCAYENYDQIQYCPICGMQKPLHPKHRNH